MGGVDQQLNVAMKVLVVGPVLEGTRAVTRILRILKPGFPCQGNLETILKAFCRRTRKSRSNAQGKLDLSRCCLKNYATSESPLHVGMSESQLSRFARCWFEARVQPS